MKRSEKIVAEIKSHKDKAQLLLRQSKMMREALKGFNTSGQKSEALKICHELDNEAVEENTKADRLTELFVAEHNNP